MRLGGRFCIFVCVRFQESRFECEFVCMVRARAGWLHAIREGAERVVESFWHFGQILGLDTEESEKVFNLAGAAALPQAHTRGDLSPGQPHVLCNAAGSDGVRGRL